MHTPVRVLRDDIEDIPGTLRHFSCSELDRRDLIVAAARRVLAEHGRLAITISSLAGALVLSPATIRRFFPDMDALMFEILNRHLRAISDEICKIRTAEPDCAARRRAAYIAATRTFQGNPNEGQIIFLRDRHTLPADLLRQIECLRYNLASILAVGQETFVLKLLDMPELSAAQVETCLTCLARPAEAASPEPAASPTEPAAIAEPATPGPARLRHHAPPQPPPSKTPPSKPRPPKRKRHKPDWSHPTLYDNAIRALARAGPR